MEYQEGIKQFYQLTTVLTHIHRKIRLLGSRCPTIKIIKFLKIYNQKNQDKQDIDILPDMDNLNYYKKESRTTGGKKNV